MGANKSGGTNPLLITAMFTPIAGVPTALALKGCPWHVVLVATVMALAGMTGLGMTCLRGERPIEYSGKATRRNKPRIPNARRVGQLDGRSTTQSNLRPDERVDVEPDAGVRTDVR